MSNFIRMALLGGLLLNGCTRQPVAPPIAGLSAAMTFGAPVPVVRTDEQWLKLLIT